MIRLTSKEQKALLLIVLILTAGTIVQFLLPHSIKSSQYDYTLQDSLFTALSADTLETESVARPQKEIIPEKKKKTKPLSQKSAVKKIKVLRPHSIKINTAGLKELETLPGIGPKTARRILDYRREHGPFKTLQELKKVQRIGSKTLHKISPYLFIKAEGNTTNEASERGPSR